MPTRNVFARLLSLYAHLLHAHIYTFVYFQFKVTALRWTQTVGHYEYRADELVWKWLYICAGSLSCWYTQYTHPIFVEFEIRILRFVVFSNSVRFNLKPSNTIQFSGNLSFHHRKLNWAKFFVCTHRINGMQCIYLPLQWPNKEYSAVKSWMEKVVKHSSMFIVHLAVNICHHYSLQLLASQFSHFGMFYFTSLILACLRICNLIELLFFISVLFSLDVMVSLEIFFALIIKNALDEYYLSIWVYFQFNFDKKKSLNSINIDFMRSRIHTLSERKRSTRKHCESNKIKIKHFENKMHFKVNQMFCIILLLCGVFQTPFVYTYTWGEYQDSRANYYIL